MSITGTTSTPDMVTKKKKEKISSTTMKWLTFIQDKNPEEAILELLDDYEFPKKLKK